MRAPSTPGPGPAARPGSALDPGGGAWRAAGSLAWLAGVAVQLQQRQVVALAAGVAVLGVAVVLGVLVLAVRVRVGDAGSGLARRVRRARPDPFPAARRALVCACLAAAGFALASVHAAARLADALDPSLEGEPLAVTGRVQEMPQWREDGARLLLEVESATRDGADVRTRVPSHVWLAWSRPQRDDRAVSVGPPPLEPGQRWALEVALRRPHGAMNPEGFDAELWLFEQGWRATGTVRGPGRLLGQQGAWIERARQRVRDALLLHGDATLAAGVLAALAVGDQAAVDGAGWELFRDTGVSHLMSISGLHITMLAWLGGAAAARLWRRSARAVHAVPAPGVARAAGVGVGFLYALLAGWGVPAQRTVVMLAGTAVLRAAGRDWPPPLVTLAAAVPVTALDPWSLLQPGFWLSFAAVGLLMVSEPARAPRFVEGPIAAAPGDAPTRPSTRASTSPPRWRLALSRLHAEARAGVRAQAVATAGLVPLTLVAFHQVSVVGFVANLVAVPWVTLVVTPLALLGAVLPPLWSLAALAVQPLMAVLRALALLPAASVHVAVAPAWIVAAALLGGLVAMLVLPWRVRAVGALMVLPLAAPPVPRPPPGRFELVAADVGQGTAVVVRTQAHLLLFDTGPRFNADTDAGGRLVLPLLQARGEPRIDRLVLSHRDADHVGGARTILDRIEVEAMSSSLEATNPLRRHAPPHTRCEAGQRWTWDGVRFEMLHPFAEGYAVADAKPNALSCVLRVSDAAGRSALLTGDVEAPQEAALVARYGPAGLHSDVLVVPHHGSRTSSTEAFLRAVSPRLAVIQVGYRSRYGHPHPDVLARYGAHGIAVVRTDACGAWIGGVDRVDCTRVVRSRYWNAPASSQAVPEAGSDVANPWVETLDGARREPGRAPH